MSTEPALVPQGLRDVVVHHVPGPGMPSGATWLGTLPRLVGELLDAWDLRIDGDSRHGYAALVLPVRRRDGTPAALKVVWPHEEAADEHRTLRAWAGHGAVRMLATDRSRWALLLERLDPSRDLRGVEVLESCEHIGLLLARLDRPATPWARRRSDHLAELVADIDAVRAAGTARHFPRRMLEQGRALALDLAGDPGVDARLLHTDLHQENVLWRPDPGEWVAIDPQTMAAEPAFGVAPALWNRWEEARAAPDLRAHLRVRLEVLCAAGGIDPDRARPLSLVRMVRNAVWCLQAPTPRTDEDVTQIITIIKALQP